MKSETLVQIVNNTHTHSLTLFSKDEIAWLEKRIFTRKTKKGEEYAVKCIVRDKDIKLTPEEIVRQLYAHRLIDEYGYSVSRLKFEYPVYFGRERKSADIVVRDKDDLNTPYIIIETKQPMAKDGREQLKSYTLATGSPIAVWTNGESITYHQRKDPNFFEDIPDIPNENQSLSDILNKPFTLEDLIR